MITEKQKRLWQVYGAEDAKELTHGQRGPKKHEMPDDAAYTEALLVYNDGYMTAGPPTATDDEPRYQINLTWGVGSRTTPPSPERSDLSTSHYDEAPLLETLRLLGKVLQNESLSPDERCRLSEALVARATSAH